MQGTYTQFGIWKYKVLQSTQQWQQFNKSIEDTSEETSVALGVSNIERRVAESLDPPGTH